MHRIHCPCGSGRITWARWADGDTQATVTPCTACPNQTDHNTLPVHIAAGCIVTDAEDEIGAMT